MRSSRVLAPLAAVCTVLAVPLAVQSATKTATFNVTATIQNDCTISAAALAFGNVGTVTANVDAVSQVTITCTPMTNYTVGLDGGSVVGSTVADRKMSKGTDRLGFQLYRDAARTQVWGLTVGTDTAGGTGTGTTETITVYGRIMPQNTPPAGNYSNTITATITY
jgi:spore coat protein U-like protein